MFNFKKIAAMNNNNNDDNAELYMENGQFPKYLWVKSKQNLFHSAWELDLHLIFKLG